MLMLLFKYLRMVFNYIQQSYSEKICKLSLITLHILGLHDFAELSEDQTHMSKIFLTAYNTWLKPKRV